MKLYVKVIAVSEEDGLKSTREDLVEIPQKLIRLNEALMGKDPEATLQGFAVSALAAALQTVQVGAQNQGAGSAIFGATGHGPIGGPVSQPQHHAEGSQHGAPPAAPRIDALGAAMGLDIIEAMDRREARQAPQPGPGPIGFGKDRHR